MAQTPLETLLIATDGSTGGEKAVRVGLELARRLGAEVEFVNAVEHGEEPADAHLATGLTLLHDLDRHRGKLALEQATGLAEEAGVRSRALQRPGHPEQVILERAGEADLVVMGTHGRGGPGRWVLGSVAEAVLARSPKPVLVVHESYTPRPGAETDFQRLLIATDGSGCSEKAARLGLELARALGAGVTFLYAVEEAWRPAASALPLAEALGLIERDTLAQAAALLEAAQAQVRESGVDAEVRLAQGRARGCILEAAREHDLVVMGTHGRTWLDRLVLGSVAEGVVRRSRAPVLVVPCPGLE